MKRIMNKIDLNDSLSSAMVKLSEGNPGAIAAMAALYKKEKEIAGALIPGFSTLLLDSFGIYGPRIWMLFKDVCGQDARTMLTVLRGVHQGFAAEKELNEIIDSTDPEMDKKAFASDMLAKVEEAFADFRKEEKDE
jgi:hypothetical protein